MVDCSVEGVLERYEAAVRRENALLNGEGTRSSWRAAGVDAYQQDVIESRAGAMIEGSGGLFAEDQEFVVDVLGNTVDLVLAAASGVQDAVRGEKNYFNLLFQMGRDSAIRLFATSAIRNIYDSGKTIAELVASSAQDLYDHTWELHAAFDEFSRETFLTSSATDSNSDVFIKMSALQVQWAQVLAQGQALQNYTGLGQTLQNLCDAIQDLFDTILAPNNVTSKIFALIARIQGDITAIIDLLVELLEVVDNALNLRERLGGVGPPFDITNQVLLAGKALVDGMAGSLDGLTEKPAYLRGDILREFILKLKGVVHAFCISLDDVKDAFDFSFVGTLLGGLEVTFEPIQGDLREQLDELKDSAEGWLLALRQHVALDTGGDFTKTLLEIQGTADTIINLAAIIGAACGVARPPGLDAAESAESAVEDAGMLQVVESQRKGDVDAIRRAQLTTATAAGELAACLAQVREERVAQNNLPSGARASLDADIQYLRARHRATIQAATIRSSLSSETVREVAVLEQQDLAVAERAKQFLE